MYNTEKKLQAVKQKLPVEKSTAPRWKIALSLGSRTRTGSACGWGGISIRKTIAMRRCPSLGLGVVFAPMKAVRVCVNVELFDNWPFELKWPRNAATVILHFPAAVLGDRKRRFAAALSALFRRCARH
jgi:hypothetical protein